MAVNSVGFGRLLEHLIQERKVWMRSRAEQKRQENLAIINSLNWVNEEGKDPLLVLPKVVWELVLGFLTDPTDLQNARLTCPLFYNLLKPRHLRDILFPLILQVPTLQRFLEKNNGNRRDSDYSTLLTLRSTCRSLRYSVNTQFAQMLSHHKLYLDECVENFGPYPPHRHVIFSGMSDDKRMSDVRNLVEAYSLNDPKRARCFVSRSLGIYPYAQEFPDTQETFPRNFQNFDNLIKSFLQAVGDQIHYFEYQATYDMLDVVGGSMSMADIYSVLCGWVELMPNLKFFELDLPSFTEHPDPVPILELIQAQSFPHLKKLEKLYLRFNNDAVQLHGIAIFEQILRSNQHVTNLSLEGPPSDTENTEGFFELIHSLNLERFSIRVRGYDLRRRNNHLENVQRVINPNWRLKRIRLDFFDCKIQPNNLFQLLETFQTLESVNIFFNIVDVSQEQNVVSLRLPNLTRFTMYCDWSGRSITMPELPEVLRSVDYLLELKKLEEISIFGFVRGDSLAQIYRNGKRKCFDEGQIVQFHGGVGDFRGRNIWQLFPNLRSLELGYFDGEESRTKAYRRGDPTVIYKY